MSGCGFVARMERSDIRVSRSWISLRSSGLRRREYQRGVMRGAPNEPLLAPGSEIELNERIITLALHQPERWPGECNRQKCGECGRRRFFEQRPRSLQMLPRGVSQLGESGIQTWSCHSSRNLVCLPAVPLQNLQWQINLSAPRMDRKSLEQARHSGTNSGVMHEVGTFAYRGTIEHHAGEKDQV